YVACAGAREEKISKRAFVVAATFVAILGFVAVIPERDAAAAEHENQRLWGFWEPARANAPAPAPEAPPFVRPPGFLFDARAHWRDVKVEQIAGDGSVRPCVLENGLKCRYGSEPWQYIAPEYLQIGGSSVPLLYMHPIAGAKVRASLAPPPYAHRA